MPSQVQNDTAPLVGHREHRSMQLRAAVTSTRIQHVTGQALRVHPHQHLLTITDVTHHQGDVVDVIKNIAVGDRPKVTELGHQMCLVTGHDMAFMSTPVSDDLGDGDACEGLLTCKGTRTLGSPERTGCIDEFTAQDDGGHSGEPA